MGFHITTKMLVGWALLFSPLTNAAPDSKSLVVLVEPSILAHQGQTATLPCWLSPPQSAQALEVRWYRDDRFETPIIFYQDQKLQTSQEASFVGRASFGLRNADSGGLRTGDVSLTLQNLTIEDLGNYRCYVSSDQGYDRGTVRLDLTKTGSVPLLSVMSTHENLLNLSCHSEGWYPRPTLLWSDRGRALTPDSLEFSNASGVGSVHSWLLVPTSSEVSCSVGLSPEDKKVSSVRLQIPPPSPIPVEQNGSSVAGWVAFALLLLAGLALLGIMWFRRRSKSSGIHDKGVEATFRCQPENDVAVTSQTGLNPLAAPVAVRPTTLQEAKKHYVNIDLEDKQIKYLRVKDGKLRDTCDEGTEMFLTAIRGTPQITSGQHYWEVSLYNDNVGVKESWWLGVTNATDFPLKGDVVPSASNGFWFLSSLPGSANKLEFSSEVKLSLSVHSRPKTVGLYLDYSSGEMAFYDVDEETVIGSFSVHFQGTVFPLFNPGYGDKATMVILKKREQEDSRDTRKDKPEEKNAEEEEPQEISAMIPK